jgi:hypothetical protein
MQQGVAMSLEKMNRRAIVILYDPDSGNVVHGHCCEVDPGIELPTREELEKCALDQARTYQEKGGLDSRKACVLHADPVTFHMYRHYRVDLKTKNLIEVKAQ